MTELKPCPFCGGEAHKAPQWEGNHHVKCLDCGVSTTCYFGKKEAIATWNRRPKDE